jgi:hypothetical protein
MEAPLRQPDKLNYTRVKLIDVMGHTVSEARIKIVTFMV